MTKTICIIFAFLGTLMTGTHLFLHWMLNNEFGQTIPFDWRFQWALLVAAFLASVIMTLLHKGEE